MISKTGLLKLVNDYKIDDCNKKLTKIFIESFDDFWSTNNLYGHVTASCWVLNKNKNKALLTHHLKLDRWFQLGGHIEEYDKTIFEASARELIEESNLSEIKLINNN